MTWFFCYFSFIICTICCFRFTAVTYTNMFVFSSLIRSPFTKTMSSCLFNCFFFCSSTNCTCISFNSLFKMTWFFCYFSFIICAVSSFSFPTFTDSFMFVFYCLIWSPFTKRMFMVLNCFFNYCKIRKTTCFKRYFPF